MSSLPGYNEAICCLVYLTFSPPSSVRPKVMPMKHEYVKMAKLRMTVVYLAANTQAFARTTMIAFLKTPVETMLPASGIIIPLEQGHVLEKVHGECAITENTFQSNCLSAFMCILANSMVVQYKKIRVLE